MEQQGKAQCAPQVSLFDRVRLEVAESLGISEHEIEMDSRLTELGADSLEKQALILSLEDEFGIEIEDKEAQKLYTVRDIMRYIENAD